MKKIVVFVNSKPGTRLEVCINEWMKKSKERYEVRIFFRKYNTLRDVFRFLLLFFKNFDAKLFYAYRAGLVNTIILMIGKLFNKKTLYGYDDFNYLESKVFGDEKGRASSLKLNYMKFNEYFPLRIASYTQVFNTYHYNYVNKLGYSNMVILTNGADFDLIKPTNVKKNFIGLKEDDLTIGYFATFGYAKLHDLYYGWDLIEAMKYLKDRKIYALFIGDGPGIKVLKDRAKEYGVEKQVKFLGWIHYNDLNKYYNLCDVLTVLFLEHPTSDMRVTFKFPEYLATGRFLILTDRGTPYNVLKKSKGAIFLKHKGIKDKEYPKRFADAVLKLYKSRRLLKDGLENREIGKKLFTYDFASQRFLDVFASIVEGNKLPKDPYFGKI